MSLAPDLVDALMSGSSRFLCISDLGAAIPAPAELATFSDSLIDTTAALDVLDSATQSAGVVCFSSALTDGRSQCQVALAATGEPVLMSVFNELETLGCVVAVVDPVGAVDQRGRAPGVVNTIPARRIRMELDVSGNTLAIDTNFTKVLGWKPEELLGLTSRKIAHADDQQASLFRWVDLLENPGVEIRDRKRLLKTDGSWVWFDLSFVHEQDGAESRVIMEATDVSIEMRAESALLEREALLTKLTEALPTGVMHVGVDGATVVSNDAWTTLTGCQRDAGTAAFIDVVDDPEQVTAELRRAIDDGVDLDIKVGFSGGAGSCEHGLLHLRPILVDSVHAGLLMTLDDLTEAHSYQVELASQARRDPLTNALNRRGIEEVLDRALVSYREAGESVAVLFIDLDKFKSINDTWGHNVGDLVLQTVSERISELLRPSDFLGRLGGDELLAVLVGLPTNDDVVAVMRRIEQELPALAVRFRDPVAISATIGAAYARTDDDFDSLIQRADEAMYTAKKAYRVD